MDNLSGYDAWKLATPWDDEVSRTVSFECCQCGTENEDVEVTVGKRDSDVDTECYECDKLNSISLEE